MTTLTFRVPGIISIASRVDDFRQAIADELDAQSTPVTDMQFTVTVADEDVNSVKREAKKLGFGFIEPEA